MQSSVHDTNTAAISHAHATAYHGNERAPMEAPSTQAANPHRVLGIIGMIGSPFLLLSFAATGAEQNITTPLGSVLGLIFALGWLANVIGLRQLDVTGRRLPGRIVLGIEIVGVVLACAFQVYEFAAPHADTLLYHVLDIAWPVSMLLLFVTGIFIAFAGVFRGWARFVPLFCGLWLPAGAAVAALAGASLGTYIGGAHVLLGWFLLGYVIFKGGNLSPR